MPPDSSEIDAAVIGVLQQDATLAGLLPDGIWMDEAPPGSQRFGLVGVAEGRDVDVFPARRAIELVRYFAKAVALSTADVNMKAAAKRIDDLLAGAILTATGYGPIVVYRDRGLSRIRDTEVDDIDASIRWYHRGGYYRAEAPIPD